MCRSGRKIFAVVLLLCGGAVCNLAQSMEPSVPRAWVRVPVAGATTTQAYAHIENPTAYAFYITKASADVAAGVELRENDKDTAVDFFTVPAYGALDMDTEGVHLLLRDLKRPLSADDKVALTLVNEIGLEFRVTATVQASATPVR
jgi:copper(I)-binding protein